MNTDNLKTQLEETINKFYSRRGIDEVANIEIEIRGNGAITIKLSTKKFLEMETLMEINQIVYLLTPLGIMHEIENHSTDQYEAQKLSSENIEINTSTSIHNENNEAHQ